MVSGYVISDLHLFTPWSAANGYMRTISAAADRADFFVLNGDIFDFRWSSLRNANATLRAASRWLRTFAERHPARRIIYIMGNHDGLRPFARRLDALAEDVPNLTWNPSHVRIGTALFTHGDLFMRQNGGGPFERQLKPGIRQRRRALRRCYRLLHAMRVHRWHAPVVRSGRCARRFFRSIEQHGNAEADGITDVYFGHTHTRFTDYAHGGIRFHNTGSMIGGLPWHLLPVKIDPPDSVGRGPNG